MQVSYSCSERSLAKFCKIFEKLYVGGSEDALLQNSQEVFEKISVEGREMLSCKILQKYLKKYPLEAGRKVTSGLSCASVSPTTKPFFVRFYSTSPLTNR